MVIFHSYVKIPEGKFRDALQARNGLKLCPLKYAEITHGQRGTRGTTYFRSGEHLRNTWLDFSASEIHQKLGENSRGNK